MHVQYIQLNPERRSILWHFNNERYFLLNKLRWDVLLGMGIPIKGQTIFEPGAGVGDQTEWLLAQGARHITVNDGRTTNLDIIRERFYGSERVSFAYGNLETSLWPELGSVDLVFLWGAYYHLRDSFEEFNVLKALARVGKSIVMEFLECPEDGIEQYGEDDASKSLSRSGIRVTLQTMLKGLKMHWNYVYLPVVQMDWVDPSVPNTPRRIVFASMEKVENDNLILQ